MRPASVDRRKGKVKVKWSYIQLYSPFGRIKIKYKNSQTGHIIKNTQNIDMHAH